MFSLHAHQLGYDDDIVSLCMPINRGGTRHNHAGVTAPIKPRCTSKNPSKLWVYPQNLHENPSFAPKTKLPTKVHTPQKKILGPPLPIKKFWSF